MRKFILTLIIGLIPTNSRTQVPTRYVMVLEVNDGTTFIDIRNPYIAQLSAGGDQYMAFKESNGSPHIIELCESEPECVSISGLRLVDLNRGE